jgi:hypothetical protein
MKAFVLDRYGSKAGLRAGEMPEPEVREREVVPGARSSPWYPTTRVQRLRLLPNP